MGIEDGRYALTIPIGRRQGRVVVVFWDVPVEMTPAEWDQMIRVMETMKDGLVVALAKPVPENLPSRDYDYGQD
jgi:hypothetical protein